MSNFMNETRNGMSNDTKHAENYLGQMAHTAGNKIGEMTAEYTNSTRNYIKRNPVKSVAVTAVAGGLIGGFVTWAMKNRQN